MKNRKCSYYVYAYIRSKDSLTAKAGTPYYIGKGLRNRAFESHSISVPKDRSKIVFLETCLTSVGAAAIERRLILWWGRKDLNTGILHNRTAGGEGSEGRIWSDESRKKLKESKKGTIISPEHRKKISRTLLANGPANKGKPGPPKTEEQKEHLRKVMKGRTPSNKGKPISEEQKQKIRTSKLKRVIDRFPRLSP